MHLSQKIITARKAQGLTQEELADLANLTVRTIQRIESGDSIPRPHTLKAIARALGSSFGELAVAAPTPVPQVPAHDIGSEKHFLQVLCLSCFSFLVIPFVHFLVPIYLLKRSKPKDAAILAAARGIINTQIYWAVSLHGLLLLTLCYNSIRNIYFGKTLFLNYLWVFFGLYFLNFVILTVTTWRVKRGRYPPAQAHITT